MRVQGMEVEAPPRVEEPRAFGSFYVEQREGLLALVHALCRKSPGEAEDIAQESFVRAYQHWHKIASYDRPDLWLRRVAINLSTSRYRRVQTEARRVVGLQSTSDESSLQLHADSMAVLEAIRRLPTRQAQVVALTYIDQLTPGEIGEVLGLSEGTVRTHLRRGLDRLREEELA